jgi:hypothetical protein
MWTANLQKESQPDGSLVVAITYSDGVRSMIDRFDVQGDMNNDYLAMKAKSKIDWLTAQDQSFTAITEGAIQPMDTPVVIPPVPDPAQVAQQQFVTDYQQWLRVKAAIDSGVLKGTEPEVIALLKKVQGEYQAPYINAI